MNPSVNIPAAVFAAYLKCPTKAYLIGVGAQIRAGAFVEAGAGSRGSAPDVRMTDAPQGQ